MREQHIAPDRQAIEAMEPFERLGLEQICWVASARQAQIQQQLAHAVDLVGQLCPAQAPRLAVCEVAPVAGIDHRLRLRLEPLMLAKQVPQRALAPPARLGVGGDFLRVDQDHGRWWLTNRVAAARR